MEGRLRFLLLTTITLYISIAVVSESDGIGEWHLLTKQNFSSQIRIHPHILLLVTVPWCGEARSLMREVTHLVTDRQEQYESLWLMYMHRNTEKMLTSSIGATEDISIFYYRHSLSYKYQGKLLAQNILYSVHSSMLVLLDEFPLKTLSTPEDLTMFLESTDKTLLLLEFCGWTPLLLDEGKSNGTKAGFDIQGASSGTSFNGETNITLTLRETVTRRLMVMEDAKMQCEIKGSVNDVPWLGEYSAINDTDTFQETEDLEPGVGLSCTFEEFQKFSSFFSRFMTTAREFFLPPERHRFGFVSERSLLSSLGLQDSSSWLVMLYLSGCPNCSKILNEEDDLRSVLQTDNQILRELDSDGVEPGVPENKPSIIMFVDRSSGLSETRQKSKEALDAFKELALHSCMDQDASDNSELSSSPVYQKPRSLKLPSIAHKKTLKEMSIMVIKDGKEVALDNIASDIQGNSLKDMLDILLQQKTKAKLSSVAKDLGFQLLSDDFDIKAVNMLPSQKELQAYETASLLPEGTLSRRVDVEKDRLPDSESSSVAGNEQEAQPVNVESSDQKEQFKRANDDTYTKLLYIKTEQLLADQGVPIHENVREEDIGFSRVDESGEQSQKYKGYFFFCDGSYRLLRALTGRLTLPTVVIIDPILKQHYVFSKDTILSQSSLADFLNGFLNGSLLSYQHSEFVHQRPREPTLPPFVNLDFHEVDPIPRVTTNTFSEVVVGTKQHYDVNALDARNKDVLVLFTNSWCGFCQRMELVVGEVYRALKRYISNVRNESRIGDKVFTEENLKNVNVKLPLIYLMDCTLNDCSLIQNYIDQKQVYPALVLFQAESKTAIPYEGDFTVAGVIKFIASRATNGHHLISENGILWTVADKRGDIFTEISSTTKHQKHSHIEEVHEVILKSATSKAVAEYKKTPSAALDVAVGSILIATQLITTEPFNSSKILIVKADENSGFEGLILNKHIGWDSIHKLEDGLEILKEAPLSFGGPLIVQARPLLALTKRSGVNPEPEVGPGIYFLDQLATISGIQKISSKNESILDYWFFLGYSSWGWNQLFDEISAGAWSISDDSSRQIEWPTDFTI